MLHRNLLDDRSEQHGVVGGGERIVVRDVDLDLARPLFGVGRFDVHTSSNQSRPHVGKYVFEFEGIGQGAVLDVALHR